VITGTAEPGATVTVYVNGNPVGTTVAGSNGTWTFTPPTPIADGTYVVTASARDTAGNEGGQSTGPTFTIDSEAPMAPVIVTPAANSTQDSDRTFEVTGVAEARSTVTIYIDGKAVGTTTADESGRFSYLVADAESLGEGPHTVEADARDAAGNTSNKSVAVPFNLRVVDQRFAGQGVIGCSAVGGLELFGVLALLGLRRRAPGGFDRREGRS
jgi:hypothetical protein